MTWVDLAVSDNVACGIHDAQLVCWGVIRELGFGPDSHDPVPPTVIEGMSELRRVVVSRSHGCVVDVRGDLRCFGSDGDGQLGQLSDVVDVAVTSGSTCAVTGKGDVHCWGYGTPNGKVSRLADAVEIAMHGQTACARTRSGEVWCWGENPGGVVGLPYEEAEVAQWPVKIEGVAGAGALTVDYGLACAEVKGKPRCWGHEERAREIEQRGALPTFGDGGACWAAKKGLSCTGWRLGPVGVDAAQVAVGIGFACAIDRQGALWCWGDNEQGQLGYAVPTERWTAEPVKGLDDAVDLALEDAMGCARRKNGAVVCWGAGAADPNDSAVPVDVGSKDLAAMGAKQATGDDLACSLEPSGEPRCWGLGALVPLRFPEEVRGTDLDVAYDLACLVTEAGGVSCIGPGAYRFGEPEDWTELVPVEGAVQVEVGEGFVCARHGDGRVSCFGQTANGRLGDGVASWSLEPVRVHPP